MSDTEIRKTCGNCEYSGLSYLDHPCLECARYDCHPRWEPQGGPDSRDKTVSTRVPAFCPDEYVEKTCYTCKHLEAPHDSGPCSSCESAGSPTGWEPRLAAETPAETAGPKTTPDTPDVTGMSNDAFEALVNELREKSLDTLVKKNARYANEDRLHNFRVGAALIGGTPAQAALGYMAKHLAALIDMVRKDDFSDRDDLLEKCQDIINYIVFIWCCGNEGRTK